MNIELARAWTKRMAGIALGGAVIYAPYYSLGVPLPIYFYVGVLLVLAVALVLDR